MGKGWRSGFGIIATLGSRARIPVYQQQLMKTRAVFLSITVARLLSRHSVVPDGAGADYTFSYATPSLVNLSA